ncbi:UNVERIFIED_CONTAM: putative serine/threonine protein kinase IRE4 [Sesamum indicum]
MAEQSQNGAASGFLSEIGIPSGLNRIKTRRVNVNPGAEDSDRFNESPSTGFSISAAPMKQKLKALNKGHPRFGRTREGFRKGRKIARWFASSFFKDSHQALGDLPSTEVLKKLDMLRKNDIDRILSERNILITVRNPFVNIFDNILNRKIPWPVVPNEMSYEAQDLIDRFLVHDPNQRLGANGASENLSQLASINQDVLLQSGKESSRCSSPCKGSNLPGS